MSGYRYGILGAGRQGTAAAYDLVVRGQGASVLLADVDVAQSERGAARVNGLTGTDVASPVGLDVQDRDALVEFMRPLDAVCAAVPYWFDMQVTTAALEAGTSVCDLGGSVRVALEQLGLNERAVRRGIRIVPECGEAPGLTNNLVAYAISLVDEPQEVVLYDGGIPQHPEPPWNYELTFNINGLTNEYDGTTTWIRDGERVEVRCLDPAEDEALDLGSLGTLEALAAGTGSTVPWTIGSRLRTFKAKVLRYPGHGCQWRAYRDAGLFAQGPVEVGEAEVVPRQVLHALLEPKIRAPEQARDLVVAQVVVEGGGPGRPTRAVVDFRAVYDQGLGFTAMEETTGWHLATMAWLMAPEQMPSGAHAVEEAVEPARMIQELRRRGFEISARVG